MKAPFRVYGLTSIRSQMMLGFGIILLFNGISAAIGYLSLQRLQANTQTALEQAAQIRELSLEVRNEFLLARQYEESFLTQWQTTGFRSHAQQYVDTNQQYLERSRAKLAEIEQLTANLEPYKTDIHRLRSLLDNYESAFSATLKRIQTNSPASELDQTLKANLDALRSQTEGFNNPEFQLIVWKIVASEQAYFNTDNQQYVNDVRFWSKKFRDLVINQTTSPLQEELLLRIDRYLQTFDQIVVLDQQVKVNTLISQSVTKEIDQITQTISETSRSGIIQARDRLTQISHQSAIALLTTATLAIIVAIAASLLLLRKIMRPLSELSQAATQMAEGNLNCSLDVRGHDEFAVVAKTFNNMASQLRQVLEDLEQRVVERTAQLSETNLALQDKTTYLETTLQELKQLQLQLIQSEKMSSLGQLVAGIAHEINNPVNFIHGNVDYLNEYTNTLLNLINLYQKELPHPDNELKEAIASSELEFLQSDLPKLLTSIHIGAKRIQEIVVSLRNFSRLDEADVKAANIHEGIDSTLLILQNRLKGTTKRPEIKVMKNYGDLPMIHCYPGQLNQVFMNLLTNAADALDDKFSDSDRHLDSEQPEIQILTQCIDDESVMIKISDNGSGIPSEIQNRLFDPFFTTKPVGQGTGLGLSISYRIITEQHQGQIRCVSHLGQSTTFIITLPVQNTSL